MSLRSLLARATARLAVRLHPHLALRQQQLPYTYEEDGLATVHNSDFLQEARFQRAYALGKQTGSWHDCDLRWRIHLLLWCAQRAAQLPGAFVECGVNRGGFARAIIDYTDFATLGREMFLFDTFAGFDPAQLSSTEQQMTSTHYHYDECYDEVCRTFSGMPFVHLVRGSVPDSLQDVGTVAFLSIDMNCAAPEIAAAEYYWPHLASGAPVLLDDYGFALHHEQKAAFDAFAQRHSVQVLSLPTGQGLIFKP